MENELYREGFNAGFILQNTAPELANLLASVSSDDPYLVGLREGKAEKELERQEEKMGELDDLRKNDDKDQEMDKDV